MSWTRRQFLRTALTGAVAIPLVGESLATGVPRHRPSTNPHVDFPLLEDLERTCFDFFWTEADGHTGLIRDRALADGGDRRTMGSIAATGFGLTALCIGHERQYQSRARITERVRRTLRFIATQQEHVHGFLYHFVDIRNGRRKTNSEISPIDMAILLCGVLTCREHFHDREIQQYATAIYSRVDWPWALDGEQTFALGWKPERGFNHLRWDEYCESMMLYLLALGSPTHPISAECWHGFRRPWIHYGDYRFISTPAPLFVHQFSHAWFDFRGKRDDYTDYFTNSVIATQAHREFCRELSQTFPCYSGEMWGITASDSSTGYVVWGGPPMLGPIDGTIVPSAAAGSLPFLFSESMAVLQNLRGYYGKQIWQRYGFVDAFNPLTGWASQDVLGIDLGISMLMTENARSEFVWETFMRNPEVKTALDKAGFHSVQPHAPSFANALDPQVGLTMPD